MEVRMSPNEFNQLRRFIGSTKDANIINNFNKILNNEFPIKTTRVPITQEVLIELSSDDGEKILKVFVNNGKTFGEMLRNDISISSISKWINFFAIIKESISKIFN